jgi:hypothetical protein
MKNILEGISVDVTGLEKIPKIYLQHKVEIVIYIANK